MESLEQRLERAGGKYALLCAGFGVLIAGVITTILSGGELQEIILHPYFRSPIAIALVSLGVSAWLLGRLSGRLIVRFPGNTFVTPAIGVALALSCLIISVVCAFIMHFFVSRDQLGHFGDYILAPALAIMAIGLIPAMLLGLVFAALMRGVR